jgi:hypothetical protein
MILAGIVDLSPTKKSTTQDNTTKEVNPIPAVPGNPESEYEEYDNLVNPYLYQLLNASWLNKASLAKIFNGKFAMAIHELKNQNNQWQFSFSVYLGTKNKEKSKELLALVQKFTALVDPNFNTQVKNDVVYCQLPKSDGLTNPLNQALGSITAVASQRLNPAHRQLPLRPKTEQPTPKKSEILHRTQSRHHIKNHVQHPVSVHLTTIFQNPQQNNIARCGRTHR